MLIYISMLYIVGVLILINIAVNSFKYKSESIFIIIIYFIIIFIYTLVIFKDNDCLFYPIHFVTILYICIFIYCPIYLILEGRTDIRGTVVMGGCVKATIIFLISYISFIVGYLSKKAPKFFSFNKLLKEEYSKKAKVNIIYLCTVIWGFGMIINLYFLISSGMSLSYIFSLGQSGEFNITDNMSTLAFVSNFGLFMVIPWLYILYYSNNSIVKFVISFITISIYFIRGFRFIIIIMIIARVLCYYREKKRYPSMKIISLGIIGSLLFISLLGFMRHDLRNGTEIKWKEFNMSQVGYALETNFNIYKPFYGLVNNYPNNYSYTFGKSMVLDTVSHFIPRAIWPTKPKASESAMAIAMKNSTNDFAYDVAGMAWPNIGEYYMEFGIVGCIILMFVLGVISKNMIGLYKSNKIHNVIIYSVFYGFMLQLITRGYTPTIVGLILFMFLPVIPIKIYSNKWRIRNSE